MTTREPMPDLCIHEDPVCCNEECEAKAEAFNKWLRRELAPRPRRGSWLTSRVLAYALWLGAKLVPQRRKFGMLMWVRPIYRKAVFRDG